MRTWRSNKTIEKVVSVLGHESEKIREVLTFHAPVKGKQSKLATLDPAPYISMLKESLTRYLGSILS
jgi:hypothetical protein